MRARRIIGSALLGTGAVALGALAAVSVAGRRVRGRHNAQLDAAQEPPDDVIHHRLVTHDGGELHVAEVGTGRPVLLLHGVTLQWWVWSATIRLLRPRYRVLAWDMRGHGRSAAGRDGVSMAAMATDVVTVLEALDLHDVVVVGHSLGGMVTGRFAADHPDVLERRVGALMFLATSAASLSIKGLAGGLSALSSVLPRAGRAALERPRLAYDWGDTNVSAAMVRLAFGSRATARMVDDVRRMLSECPPRTLMEAGAAIAEHDVRSSLGGIRVPTTVVVGDEDRLTPPPHARMLASLVAGSELVELHGVGHQVMQEAPNELTAAIDHLTNVGASVRSAAGDLE